MAWHIPISTSQSGTVVTMVANDDLFVDEDVLIASTGTTSSDITVLGATGHRITIEGSVLAGDARAIHLNGATNALNNNVILVKAGGEVGSFESHAIAIVGAGTSITNHGYIHGDNTGILLAGHLATATTNIVNTGTLEGDNGGIVRSSAASSETIVLRNSGTIVSGSGAAYGLFGNASGRDVIINTGRMIGDILLGTSGDSYNGATGRLTGDVFGFGGNDILIGGIDGNVFEGGIGADTLTGNRGNDTLRGDAGADKLNGGLGKDTLTGGADADRFIFSAKTHSVVGANADRITDFDDGNAGDRIDLSALFGPALTYRHALAFTAAGQVRINDVAGADVVVEVNTGGTLAADFSIRLAGTTLASMNAGDFLL